MDFRKLLKKGFSAVHKHREKIIILVEMMWCGNGRNLKCFEGGQETIDNLECNFSTTTQVAQVTSQVSIMSGMKQYFVYKALMAGCGISNITLEGSIQDWEKIKSKCEFLSTKGLEWYTNILYLLLITL